MSDLSKVQQLFFQKRIQNFSRGLTLHCCDQLLMPNDQSHPGHIRVIHLSFLVLSLECPRKRIKDLPAGDSFRTNPNNLLQTFSNKFKQCHVNGVNGRISTWRPNSSAVARGWRKYHPQAAAKVTAQVTPKSMGAGKAMYPFGCWRPSLGWRPSLCIHLGVYISGDPRVLSPLG